jgi:hypothetical protein
MASDAMQGKKPSGAVDISKLGMGLEKDPAAEVSGHVTGFYHCHNCNQVSWVDSESDSFVCPYCFVVNNL